MNKIVNFLIFLLPAVLFGQYSIQGSFTGKTSPEWVILYRLQGASQLYLSNETVEDKSFKLELDEDSTPGMYRVVYGNTNDSYVDLIWNKEHIELEINDDQNDKVVVGKSVENEIYFEYLYKGLRLQTALDNVQYAYFAMEDEAEIAQSKKDYQLMKDTFLEHQSTFEKRSEHLIASSFIKAGNRYFSDSLISEPQRYLDSEKAHFFDYLNFDDEILLRSSLFSERVINFMFYLNRSDDYQMQMLLFKQGLAKIMDEIGPNDFVRSEILTILLHTFVQTEMVEMVDLAINSYYNSLPIELQDPAFLDELYKGLRLAVGKEAPDFKWEENGTTKSLSSEAGASKVILVFWSSECSHCLNEVPQLYAYTRGRDDIQVIAIAMETGREGFDQYSAEFDGWTNVLALNKWEHPIPLSYEINATPAYFILDSERKILAKPEYFRDVKSFLEDQK